MRSAAVRIGPRSALVLLLASLAGLAMFAWPLLVPASGAGHAGDAPLVFVAVLPVLVAVVLAQLSEGGMDSKALAMLGVLSAVIAALRPLGAGTAGIETVFFLLVLAGRVFGPGFGFVLGCTSLFASALLTGGVGPWLPFQMLASAWIGLGAGLLPRRVTGRAEVGLLVAYGVVVAYAYGALLNLWFWPFAAGVGGVGGVGPVGGAGGGAGGTGGGGSALAYLPGAPLGTNLHRFAVFTLLTSTGGWDTGRALTDAIAILALGPAVLTTLRRAARRARFDDRQRGER